MMVRCVRCFFYETMRMVGDEWDDDRWQELLCSGNCVFAAWEPTIHPWPVAVPPAPLAPAGP